MENLVQRSFTHFPPEYQAYLKEKVDAELETIKNNYSLRINQIESEVVEMPTIEKGEPGALAAAAIYLFPLMVFFGVMTLAEAIRGDVNSSVTIFSACLCAFSCVLIHYFYGKECRRFDKKYNLQLEEAEKNYCAQIMKKQDRIRKEKIAWEEERLLVYQKAEKENKEYRNSFDKAVSAVVSRYSSGTYAKDIIAWLSKPAIKLVLDADRRISQSEVVVMFDFDVYRDRIVTDKGVFTLSNPPIAFSSIEDAYRLTNLETPVHQEALCRVLASMVKMNIMKEFPEDPSGGAIKARTATITDYYDFAHARIAYTAINAKYVPVQQW